MIFVAVSIMVVIIMTRAIGVAVFMTFVTGVFMVAMIRVVAGSVFIATGMILVAPMRVAVAGVFMIVLFICHHYLV